MRQHSRLTSLVATCAALWLVAGPLAAQDKPSAPAGKSELPPAEQILDRYVEVTGGRSAYERLKSRVAQATISIEAANIKGSFTMYQMEPNLMAAESRMENLGVSREVFDGRIAWENSDLMGPRLKEGEELAVARRSATFNSEIHWRKLYKKVETVGQAEVEGRKAWKLELTPHEGRPEQQFYDQQSGLLIKSEMMLPTQFGDIPVESIVADFREVDGVKLPHKLTQRVAVQEVVITIDKIEHNVKIDRARFEPPDEIKELIAKAEKPEGDDATNKPAEKPADTP